MALYENRMILWIITSSSEYGVDKAKQSDPNLDFTRVQWMIGVRNGVGHHKPNRIVDILECFNLKIAYKLRMSPARE